MIVRSQLGFYNNVGMTATYDVPTEALRSRDTAGVQDLIAHALVEVVKVQPIMGICITADSSATPQWKRLASYNLADVLEVKQRDSKWDLDTFVQGQHRTHLDNTKEQPLWNVVALYDDLEGTSEKTTITVGFSAHHAIADGMSCAAFHLTLLEALNGLVQGTVQGSMPDDGIVPLLHADLVPNLELLTPLPVTVWYLIKRIFTEFVYSPVDYKSWLGPVINFSVPTEPTPSCHRSFSLPSKTVDVLIRKCRENQTTLTALISTLIARHLAEQYKDGFTHFIAKVPFSLRRFTTLSNREMGCFVTDVGMTFSSDEKPAASHIPCQSTSKALDADKALWESARKCRHTITESTGSAANQSVGMLKYIANDFKGFFLGKQGARREGAFELSNLGVVDGGLLHMDGKVSPVTFGNILFSTSVNPYGAAYVFTAITVKGGDLTITLNWDEAVFETDEAERAQTYLHNSLQEIGAI